MSETPMSKKVDPERPNPERPNPEVKTPNVPEAFLKFPRRLRVHIMDCLDAQPDPEDDFDFYVNGKCPSGIDCQNTNEGHWIYSKHL